MATFEITSPLFSIEVVTTQTAIPMEVVLDLINTVAEMHTHIPLSSVTVELQSDGTFDYVISTVDSRIFSQRFRIINNQFEMTFDVPSWWRLDEFLFHRPIRDLVESLLINYGVTKIEMSY